MDQVQAQHSSLSKTKRCWWSPLGLRQTHSIDFTRLTQRVEYLLYLPCNYTFPLKDDALWLYQRGMDRTREKIYGMWKKYQRKKNFGVVPDVISTRIFVSFFTILSILYLLLFWYLWYYQPHSMRNFHAL